MIRPHDLVTYSLPQIRRAAPADIPAIVAIENESFADPWDQSVFLEALTYYPSTYFVAICDGAVAGFIVGGLEDTGENIYGHLCNIGVSPRYRRRGVGQSPCPQDRAPVRPRAGHRCPAGSPGLQYRGAAVLPAHGIPPGVWHRPVLRQWRGRARHDEVVPVLSVDSSTLKRGKTCTGENLRVTGLLTRWRREPFLSPRTTPAPCESVVLSSEKLSQYGGARAAGVKATIAVAPTLSAFLQISAERKNQVFSRAGK